MNCRGGAGCSAFTLIEVMIATGLVGFVFFTIYAGFTFGFAVVQLNRENLRATQLLQEKMELIRLYNWDQITNSGYLPTTFSEAFYPGASTNAGPTYTGTVTVDNAPITESYSGDMRRVTIQLTWTSAKVLRRREMTTFVSRYGLQNYIY